MKTCSGVILLLIIHIVGAEQCDREISRRVRKFLVNEVFDQLNIKTISIPPTCPIGTLSDLYADQEDHKREVNRNEWRCLYCNKRFISEFYLDRHMDNKHKNTLNLNTSICLADYCDMFGCRIRDKQFKFEPGNMNTKKKILTLERCSEEKVKSLRHNCTILAKSCFHETPYEKAFQERVCNTIRCDKGVFRGGIKSTDEKKNGFIVNIFRFVSIVLLLGVIFIYAILSDSFWRILKISSRKTDRHDYFSDYMKVIAGLQNWWFWATIGDAFKLALRNFSAQQKVRQGKAS